MKEKIIKILKEIEKAEDTKEVIFPLLYELSKIKKDIGSEELLNLMMKDKEVSKIWGRVVEKTAKYVLDLKGVENSSKEWSVYKNKRL